jgi:hypothetical protein
VWVCSHSPNSYHGVSAYIDSEALRTFTHDLEAFQRTCARIEFSEMSAHIFVSTTTARQIPESLDISLDVSCARFGFQVSAMVDICIGLLGTGTGFGAGAAI